MTRINAIDQVAQATAGHQPGQGYELTRHQFFRFLEELEDQALLPADWQEEWCDQRAALWRHIGAREASRVFTEMGCCPSVLSITTEVMEWEYVTTSGTAILALDHRQARGSVHVVWIPESRDQPGRTAWTQIRLALSGLAFGTARAALAIT